MSHEDDYSIIRILYFSQLSFIPLNQILSALAEPYKYAPLVRVIHAENACAGCLVHRLTRDTLNKADDDGFGTDPEDQSN